MKFLILFCVFISYQTVIAQNDNVMQSFSVALFEGENLEFGDKTIQFKKVLSDSRCPKDVTCIWEGEAKVLVEVYKGETLIEERIINIKAAGSPLQFVSKDINYAISSWNLLPYPTVASKNNMSNYTLEMKITGSL